MNTLVTIAKKLLLEDCKVVGMPPDSYEVAVAVDTAAAMLNSAGANCDDQIQNGINELSAQMGVDPLSYEDRLVPNPNKGGKIGH